MRHPAKLSNILEKSNQKTYQSRRIGIKYRLCTLAFAFTKLNETWIKLNQLIVSEINTEKISFVILIDKIYLHLHSCATSRKNLNVFAKVLPSDNND